VSVAGREEFLAGTHVGVLNTAAGTAGLTLAVSVWYRNRPGSLLTGRRLRKAAATDQPQASSQGLILIACGDLSPLQNILFGAA
jgi:hypothetical protein